MVKFLSDSSSFDDEKELIGSLDKDLNLKNLGNEDLFNRLRESFKPESDSVVDKTLPDGKSGMFYVSKRKQAYVDCTCFHDFRNEKVSVQVRIYRLVSLPKVLSARYKTYTLYECDMDSWDSLPVKERSFVSNFARNLIKKLSKERDFISIREKCLNTKISDRKGR